MGRESDRVHRLEIRIVKRALVTVLHSLPSHDITATTVPLLLFVLLFTSPYAQVRGKV
jgi:hypothetical protein